MKELMLTTEQIEQAKKDEGHPVTKIFLEMDDYIKEFVKGYKEIENGRDARKFRRENLKLITRKLDDIEDFSLEPLDIVSVWSGVCKNFGSLLYTRYNLAGIIPVVYGTRRINAPNWKGILPFVARTDEFREMVRDESEENQIYFWKRLKDIKENLEELSFYMNGTRESVFELSRRAYKGEGDKEAEERLEQITIWRENHNGKFISEIDENFGVGFKSLFMDMPEKIKEKIQ